MRTMGPVEFVWRIRDNTGKSAKYALWPGAGCSLDYGIPDAAGLGRKWLEEIWKFSGRGGVPFGDWLKEYFPDYEEDPAAYYFDIIKRRFTFFNELEAELERISGSPTFLDKGVYKDLEILFNNEKYRQHFNVVITTNFDGFLKKISCYEGKKLDIMQDEINDYDYDKINPTALLFIYLYGDMKHNCGCDDRSLISFFQKIFSKYGLIFAGYGGNDKTIAGLLRQLPENCPRWGVYWVNKKPPGYALRTWLEERGAVWVKADINDIKSVIYNKPGNASPGNDCPDGGNEITEEEIREKNFDSALCREYANKIESNNPDKARRFYELSLAGEPEHRKTHNRLANLLVRLNLMTQADQHFRESLKGDPVPKNYFEDYIKFLEGCGRSSKAEEVRERFRKMFGIEPEV